MSYCGQMHFTCDPDGGSQGLWYIDVACVGSCCSDSSIMLDTLCKCTTAQCYIKIIKQQHRSLYIFLSLYPRSTFNCKDTIVFDQYFGLGPSSGSIEFWCITSSQYIIDPDDGPRPKY